MSLFGTSTSTTPVTGTSLFGANNSAINTNQPAGGNIFGSFGSGALVPSANTNANAQQPASTSIFGTPLNNANSNIQQNQQPATSSLFGNTNTNAAAGTSSGTGTSLFGTTAPAGNMFGKPATPAPGTGTSLFGNTSTPGTTGTTSLFGGNTAQQPPANTGTNSFFATPPAGQQQQQNPNQPKPSLFGSTTTNPLFGGSTTNAAGSSTGTGSLFGAGSTTTSSNPLFGCSTTGTTGTGPGSLFGSTAAPSNAAGNTLGSGSLFGGVSSTLGGSTLGTGALGAKPAGGLGVSALGAQNQGADAQVQFARLQEKIESIVGAWNAQNPALCRFQHYFYNLVDPSQINLYTRPPNAVNEALWQKAVRENPDPTCLVPALALGFDDLRDRVNAQVAQSGTQKEKLLELQKKLQILTTNHSTVTVPRLQRYSALQTQLMHRLLRLVQHLHLLIPSVRSSAIGEGEEALRGALEEVMAEVGVGGSSSAGDGAGKGGRIKSKMGELWAVVGALKAREESLNAVVGGSGEWKVVDEDGLARITQILAEQQAGLAHLTKILQKDLKDLAIVMGTARSSVSEDNEDENVFGSSFASRDSTMRGSTLSMSALR